MNKIVALSIFLFFSFATYSQNKIIPLVIEKQDLSGNNQSAITGTTLPDSVYFKVVNQYGEGQANQKVMLRSQLLPHSSPLLLSDSILTTNAHGICGTRVTLGANKGTYHIVASIDSTSEERVLVYTFEAKHKIWVFFLIIGIAGGLVLFLYGMNTMSQGLQKAAGDKMRTILSSLTRNNFVGLIVGALITGVIQSSSATSVMLISFVHSGLMRFRQTLSILLGATIGSTITVQLISFKLTEYSLFFVAIGGALYLFAKKNSSRFWGESVFGFGLLFFGMLIMFESIAPIKSSPVFIDIFLTLQNPFLGILVGALFGAMVQSSAASIGIFIILASQGLLPLESCIALIIGANLGTPVAPLIASLKTSHDAKRVAITMLLYRLLLVVVFVWFIHPIAQYVSEGYSNQELTARMPRIIANIHTSFNIIIALVIFPFLPWVEKLILKIKPLKSYELHHKSTRYLDNTFINQPAIALKLAKEETLRVGRKIQYSLELVIKPFIENEPEYLLVLETQREEVKNLRDTIKEYLLKTAQFDSSKQRTEEVFSIIHTLTELSHINNVLTKVLHRRAEKWIERDYEITEQEKIDILAYHSSTVELYNRALMLFEYFTIEDALIVKTTAKEQSQKAWKIEKEHYSRLFESEKEEERNSKTYLELIAMLKTIGFHASNICAESANLA